VLQKPPDSIIVGVRSVDSLQYRAIPVQQALHGHCRNETQIAADVVSICVADKASFVLQPPVELRTWKCLEKPYHCDWEGALLDEFDLPVEYIIRIAIEADDESGHNLDTMSLNAAHAVEQAALRVL
jgi:hypothetical protein